MPAVGMEPYLHPSGQRSMLKKISIDTLRGESREQMRLLYMNPAAVRIWEEMGKAPRIIGAQVRPPQKALFAFGVPFSE